MRALRIILILVVVAFMATVVPIRAAPPVMWPTTSWQTSTPEEQGMDSAALADFVEKAPTVGAIDSVMVVRNGYVVAEVYWHPFQSGMKRELMSASKSVISALVGIALDKGYIKSLDQKVLDFFPGVEVKNLDDNKRAMTLRHLLTMTSGFECDITKGNDPLVDLIIRVDAAQFGLDWKMADKPGTTWRYCQINVYLLSAILKKTTGMDTLAFAKQVLFAPLGITDVSWNASAEGVPLGYAGLMLNTRDMAKIGYLFLNNGRWEDKQVVPAEWVKASTQNYAPQKPWDVPDVGYGYLWWSYHTTSGDFIEAQGAYSQHIRASLAKNLVVIDTAEDMTFHLANIATPTFMKEFLNLAKSDTPLPANPQGMARLEAAIRAAANPKAQPSDALPPLAARISGKTYRLATPDLLLADNDRNSLPQTDWQIATLGLDFDKGMATLRLQTQSGKDVSVPVGLDGVYRVATSHFGTLAARGKWETATRFVLVLRRLEQGPVLKYTLNFKDNGFTGNAESARPGDVFAPKPISLTGVMVEVEARVQPCGVWAMSR
jgi:CubicO group peptidase (beta-lactamase class C family)